MNPLNLVARYNYNEFIPSTFEGLLDVFDRYVGPSAL
jgi:hypothetical protein